MNQERQKNGIKKIIKIKRAGEIKIIRTEKKTKAYNIKRINKWIEKKYQQWEILTEITKKKWININENDDL